MPTANEVMTIAKKQIGYKESPANSNRTKYGRKFGMNGAPWCFIFEWWCGWKASKKKGGTNPFPHSANAAYGQDDIVNKMGGAWVLRKTTSKQARKDALKKYRAGDCAGSAGFGNEGAGAGRPEGRSGGHYGRTAGRTAGQGACQRAEAV